jgi:hypothetical protein
MENRKLQRKMAERQQSISHLLLELVSELECFKKLTSGLDTGTPVNQQIKSVSELRKSAAELFAKSKGLEKSLMKQRKLEGELPAKPKKKAKVKPAKAAAKSAKPEAKAKSQG